MFRTVLFAAVLAGLVAGLGFSLVQAWRVTPLILAAEQYEGPAHSHGTEDATHSHASEAAPAATPGPSNPLDDDFMPQDGIERTAYTVLANVLVSIGFALVAGALSLALALPLTSANGLIWAFCGFAALGLSPAMGLAPELPGMIAAEIGERQIWWWSAALSVLVAAVLMAKLRKPWAVAAGIVLIALPHMIGAPVAPAHDSGLPAELATAYAANALGAQAVLWALMMPLMGFVSARVGNKTEARA